MIAASTRVASAPGSLLRDGFEFVPGVQMHERLACLGSLADWERFAASWEDLALDTYLAEHGRYRRRRYAVYHIGADDIALREAHQPHYQSQHYNPLQGGIERWFEPIQADIGASTSLQAIFRFCKDTFAAVKPGVAEWHVEVHQFRIEARPDAPGQPTPEGVHRDGVDFVLVLLINRVNIASGTTTIHASTDRRLLGSFTLTQPMDAALVDDARVFHGVTAVESMDPRLPAYRDVLVVTFRQQR